MHAVQQSAASPTAYSIEPSEASYSSSTSSLGKVKSHAAKDHKAALHAANGRLQKAIQSAAKKKAASSGAASPSGNTPGSTSAADVSTRSAPGNAAESPSENTLSHTPGVQTSQPGVSPSTSKLGSASSQAACPTGQLQKTQTDRQAHSLPNTRSEASVLSAESDDDADFLTGDCC